MYLFILRPCDGNERSRRRVTHPMTVIALDHKEDNRDFINCVEREFKGKTSDGNPHGGRMRPTTRSSWRTKSLVQLGPYPRRYAPAGIAFRSAIRAQSCTARNSAARTDGPEPFTYLALYEISDKAACNQGHADHCFTDRMPISKSSFLEAFQEADFDPLSDAAAGWL